MTFSEKDAECFDFEALEVRAGLANARRERDGALRLFVWTFCACVLACALVVFVLAL